MRKHYIYILKCPITNDIRYVGQSVNPKVRYRRHISESKRRNDHKCNWVKSLLDKNKKPGTFESIKECSEKLNLNRPKISMVLNGLRPHHKGFTFKAV